MPALLSLGPDGWGDELLAGTGMTLLLALAAFAIGLAVGTVGALAALSGSRALRSASLLYTTVLRGVPPLLVVWLLFFGGGALADWLVRLSGLGGPVAPGPFALGTVALGLVSGAYATEALRGGALAVPRGQLDAARALGMPWPLVLRRVLGPLALRHALPALGNVWQMTLKDTALVSVTALTELIRAASVASAATHRPFLFYAVAAALYLMLAALSELLFRAAERQHGRRRAAS